MKTKNPTHSITLEIWCDLKTDIWHAKITYGETRNGVQYGGKVVDEMKSKPGCHHQKFLRSIRSNVKKNIDVFWT